VQPGCGNYVYLESKIKELSKNPDHPEPVPPLPLVAERVTGQTYIMDPNPLGLQSVSLNFLVETEVQIRMINSLNEPQVDPAGSQKINDVEWNIGLDNIYRFEPGPYDIPMGLKGWWESEETFVIYVDYIDDTRQDRILLTFQGDQITIQMITEGEGELASFKGRLDG